MEYGFVCALVAMVGWGISNGVTRTPAIRIGVVSTLFYRNLFVFLLLLPITFINSGIDRLTVNGVAFTFGLSLLGYISLLSLFKAQKTGKVGIINPIASSGCALIVLVISLAVYHQRLSLGQLIAVILIIGGCVFGSVSFSDVKSSSILDKKSGLGFALLTAIFWGVMFGFMVEPVREIGPWWTALILNLGNLILSFMHLQIGGHKLARPDGISLGVTFLAGIGGAVAIATYNFALLIIPIGIAGAIAGISPLVTILIGIYAYKERHTFQHIIGMGCALTGVVAINLAR